MPKSTTIQVRTDTKDRLEYLRAKGETYNDLLERLINKIGEEDTFLKSAFERVREVREDEVKTIPIGQFKRERRRRYKRSV